MNLKDDVYSRYKLVQEMMQTPDIIRRFDPKAAHSFVPALKNCGRLFMTGEGSSRIFPAKRAIYDVLKNGDSLSLSSDGATRSIEAPWRTPMPMAASPAHAVIPCRFS